MKDSVRQFRDIGFVFASAATFALLAGCRRSDKTADVAQDSILVRDADTTLPRPTVRDTMSTLVRDRGAVSATPSLTNGARVKRAPAQMQPPAAPVYDPGIPAPQMPPPKKVNPPLVLPSTRTPAPPPPPPPTSPPAPTTAPQPVVVPASPPPAPKPPTDSGKDTIKVARVRSS